MYTVKVTESFSGKSEIFHPQTKEEFETFANVYKFSFPDQEYKVNDVLHRESGPAKIWHDEEGFPIYEYYTDGKLIRMISCGRFSYRDTFYEGDIQTVKMSAQKNIDGVEIRGNMITVYKNDEKISETFEPNETWKEAAEKRLKNLTYRIRTLEIELRQKSKLEEEFTQAQKEYTELTNKLNTLQQE